MEILPPVLLPYSIVGSAGVIDPDGLKKLFQYLLHPWDQKSIYSVSLLPKSSDFTSVAFKCVFVFFLIRSCPFVFRQPLLGCLGLLKDPQVGIVDLDGPFRELMEQLLREVCVIRTVR